jgi:glycosyltransferase involved in cell wall biosynthesis
MNAMPKPTMIYHHRTQAVDAQGIHIHEMCRAFRAIGWNVEMVALVSDEAVGKVSRRGGVFDLLSKLPPFLYEIMEIGYNFVGVCRLYRNVRRVRPAFIYERYSLYNFAGALVSAMTGVPLIEEINAPLAYEKQHYDRLHFPALARLIERCIVHGSRKTIAVTGVLRRMLIRDGAPAEKIVVMHNGVNPDEYIGRNEPPTPERLVIGFVGWFRDWHGLAEVVRSMGTHRWGERGVRLLLVGDGPAREDLEAEIRRNEVADFVSITGEASREEVRTRLAEMDIALQPAATSYACPMKLIEYMAAGKAIVAPAQDNIMELLAHERNGLLFEPGNWKDFASRVERLIEDRELAASLGESARDTVRSRGLTWEDNARRVLRLLER